MQLVAERSFRLDGLSAVRRVAKQAARQSGADEYQADAVVIVANELATNAIMHGGGTGRLRVWRTPTHVVCEVSDSGPGLPDPFGAGWVPVPPEADCGRGLWLVRRLADTVEIDSGDGGTTVIAWMAVDALILAACRSFGSASSAPRA
jgi:anti-sigma regulatory factor (Ser/Thr protein kinase)